MRLLTTLWFSRKTLSCFYVYTMYIESVFTFFVAPPSFPADVRVFSGPESATISWTRPSFVQSFFGKYFTCVYPVQ